MPLVGAVLLVACGAEPPADDFAEPVGDADLADDADAPLLPPNTGYDDDAAVADDAAMSSFDDVAADDAPIAADTSVTGVDAAPPVDVASRADVPSVDVHDAGATRCTGSASGQSAVWTCTTTGAARQRCVAGVVHTEACAHGCTARPSGTDDVCAPAPPPPPANPTTLPTCAHRPLLHWGLHPLASDHLRCAGVPNARITQTIGYAVASAGTHAPDGSANGMQYSAATDISVSGLSHAAIGTLISTLADQGFAAWFRWPGHDGWPSADALHIHAIFVGVPMKASLRSQVGSWLAGRNGLVSNSVYTFHTWTAPQRALIRAVFNAAN